MLNVLYLPPFWSCRKDWLFLCPSVLIRSYRSVCWCTPCDTSAAHGHCFFLKKHHCSPKVAATCRIPSCADIFALPFLWCVYICNPSVTGTSTSNLELINCCFQFLRVKQQQVTICTSLLPLHNLTALDLHQRWPFFSEHFVLLALLFIYYFRENKE